MIANLTREQRTEQAFFRGDSLTLDNGRYRATVCALLSTLLKDDMAPTDLTAKALDLAERDVTASIIARAAGIAAGLCEFAFFAREHGVEVSAEKSDGDVILREELLLRVSGPENTILALERVGLNLLQRMSGIATAAHCLQERLRQTGATARVVGTRKTPWGLLDKRALHLGGAGTHRLGLGDAILIKNNHLALIATTEEEAAPAAIEKAWSRRDESAFIEIEVRSQGAALAAVSTFERLQGGASAQYPCLLLLDNMTPAQMREIIQMLQQESMWDYVLIEASGGISEANVEQYAATGVDAISIGALTHSARALDICLRIS